MGGLNFLLIRDLSGLVQVLVEDDLEIEKLRGAQIGTILDIVGDVIKDERAPNGIEIHKPQIKVNVVVNEEPPIEIDKPIDHKPENLDTLFEYRQLNLRNLNEQTVFMVQDEITRQIRDFLHNKLFTEIRTPKLLAEATEGGAEVFKLDYFGKTATLAQSPQFYKQMMVGVFERVFEIAPVFRAEPSATTRHMSEYISVDGEMGFIEFPELQNLICELLIKINIGVWNKYADQLKRWNASPAVLPEKPEDIPRLTIHDIHEMFYRARKIS
jgi:nondiscriminating aspartyl-tRNA synthetase